MYEHYFSDLSRLNSACKLNHQNVRVLVEYVISLRLRKCPTFMHTSSVLSKFLSLELYFFAYTFWLKMLIYRRNEQFVVLTGIMLKKICPLIFIFCIKLPHILITDLCMCKMLRQITGKVTIVNLKGVIV